MLNKYGNPAARQAWIWALGGAFALASTVVASCSNDQHPAFAGCVAVARDAGADAADGAARFTDAAIPCVGPNGVVVGGPGGPGIGPGGVPPVGTIGNGGIDNGVAGSGGTTGFGVGGDMGIGAFGAGTGGSTFGLGGSTFGVGGSTGFGIPGGTLPGFGGTGF